MEYPTYRAVLRGVPARANPDKIEPDLQVLAIGKDGMTAINKWAKDVLKPFAGKNADGGPKHPAVHVEVYETKEVFLWSVLPESEGK